MTDPFGLRFRPPLMKHGESKRIADFMEQMDMPLQPWQRVFLERIESASIAEQFRRIVVDGL